MTTCETLIEHMDAASVLAAYRGEKDRVRRAHLQVIWLLLSGDPVAEVARVTGFSGRWIAILIGRWNAHGAAGLGDRRRSNAGAKPLLDEAGLAALAAALAAAPADGGLWNGRQVAAWMSAYLGRPVSVKRGLDYLHKLDYSLQRPRPKHSRSASPEDYQAYKKNSTKRWLKHVGEGPAASSKSGPSTNTGSA